MKIVLPGGTGFLGQVLTKKFLDQNHEVVVLSRGGGVSPARLVPWDACTLGEWSREIDGASAVINLTGQSVKCLYTDKNLKTLRSSRIKSTQVVGEAIKQAKKPPAVWIQLSSSSIYTHSFDVGNDELKGRIGESKKAPLTWKHIVQLIRDWESALYSSSTKNTRKVIVRLGVVMSLNPKSAFNIFLKLCQWGLGGSIAGGKQMISWIHEKDFIQGISFLLKDTSLEGPVNLSSPLPISQGECMKVLREAVGRNFGLPATKWMLELSSYLTGIDSELSLKSRYVIPQVLLDKNFPFHFPDWPSAVKDLVPVKGP